MAKQVQKILVLAAKGRQLFERHRYGKLWLYFLIAIESSAYAQGLSERLVASEPVLVKALVGLVAMLVFLGAWELYSNRQESRSSLDIAKLAAAAAKRHSSSTSPSGSYGSISQPVQPSPFAPPPPPPPPPPAPSAPLSAPEAVKAPAPALDLGFVPPPQAAPKQAFSPSGSADAGSSGGWADLLQRVRAEDSIPEPSSLSTAPTSHAPVSFSPPESSALSTNASSEAIAASAPVQASSSSEAWEALLKRTTGSNIGIDSADKSGASDKISLGSNFQPPDPTKTPAFGTDSNTGSEAFLPPAQLEDKSYPGGLASSSSQTIGVFHDSMSQPQPALSPFAGGVNFASPSNLPPLGESSPSSTLPLSDLFAAKSNPPASPFQLPGIAGTQPSHLSSPDAGPPNLGRTISLDFLTGGGQAPPPPLPKTEG